MPACSSLWTTRFRTPERELEISFSASNLSMAAQLTLLIRDKPFAEIESRARRKKQKTGSASPHHQRTSQSNSRSGCDMQSRQQKIARLQFERLKALSGEGRGGGGIFQKDALAPSANRRSLV